MGGSEKQAIQNSEPKVQNFPRILHILEATRGGTRTHLLDLLPALAERGLECGLAYSSERNPDFARDARALEARGVRCWEVAMRRGPHFDDARAVGELARIARGFGPDLIHAHSSKAGFLARLSWPLVRAPIVYTPHCVAFDTSLPRPQRRLARWAEVALSPLAARFIAVSQTEARALERVLPASANRITLIRNGLDLSLFPPPEEQEAPAREGSYLTIGCFGRLCAQKNQAVLLHALALLLRGGLQVRLLLVGGGEDEPRLHDLARVLGIAEHIEWAGEVADARPFYARCDVVALPSRWEGCPYSLLEAMASSRAVVASDIAPLREILISGGTKAGVLCSARPELMAHELFKLARDSERRQVLGRAARARIGEAFRLQRMVEQTMRVYAEVTRA